MGELAEDIDALGAGIERAVNTTAQERERLSSTLNASIDGVAAVDRELNVLFANDALHRLLDSAGRPRTTWSATRSSGLCPTSSSSTTSAPAATRSAQRHPDRTPGAPLLPGRDDADRQWRSLGRAWWCHDLTDVRRAELQRRDFVGNVSHELRTPLAALRSVIETLQDGALEDRPAAEDFLRRADHEVERLINLVEELLELSRIESGELPLDIQPVDVTTLLREALELAKPEANRRRVELKLDVDPELGVVELDAKHIDRAVLNLVQNAIKFTPPAGSVTVARGVSTTRWRSRCVIRA